MAHSLHKKNTKKIFFYALFLFLFSFNLYSQETSYNPQEVLKSVLTSVQKAHTPRSSLKELYDKSIARNTPADSLLYWSLLGYKQAKIKNDAYYKILFLEAIGDAYSALGFTDSAIAYYNRALSSTDNPFVKARLLRKKGKEMSALLQTNTALVHLERAQDLAREKHNYSELIAVYSFLARIQIIKGNLNKAENYLKKASEIERKHPNPLLKVKILKGYTTVYLKKGQLSKLLEYALKMLKHTENLGDKKSLAEAYGQMGIYYTIKQDSARSIEFYLKALKIWKELKHFGEIASVYNNLGILYYYTLQYRKSLEYYFKSIHFNRKLSPGKDVSPSLINIGTIYNAIGKQDSALYYYHLAMKEKQKKEDIYGIAVILNNIGQVFKTHKEYSKALEYFRKTYFLALQHNLSNLQKSALEHIYLTFEKMGKFDSALVYYRDFHNLLDSLEGSKVQRLLLEKEIEYKFQKEQELQKSQFETREKIQLIIMAAIGGVLLVALVFLALYIGKYRTVFKQKNFIETQQRILIQKNIEINEQQQKQKEILEKLRQKNKRILDSLFAAKNIQQALFQTSEEVRKELPQHFLFFAPREIVSGDFYWIRQKNNKVFIAVGDCTGHGVPAAFLTILGITYLDKILDGGEETPGKMLDKLKKMVVHTLNIDTERLQQKEGMDISLIKLDLKTQQLEYAGAYNSLYILTESPDTLKEVRNKASGFLKEYQRGNIFLMEISADKQPIGVSYREPHPFTTHTFQMTPYDEVVLFTDGFPDQFGGKKGKKFGYRWFKQMFLRLYPLPISQQEQKLTETFFKWLGHFEQLDDVLVFGMRYKDKETGQS